MYCETLITPTTCYGLVPCNLRDFSTRSSTACSPCSSQETLPCLKPGRCGATEDQSPFLKEPGSTFAHKPTDWPTETMFQSGAEALLQKALDRCWLPPLVESLKAHCVAQRGTLSLSQLGRWRPSYSRVFVEATWSFQERPLEFLWAAIPPTSAHKALRHVFQCQWCHHAPSSEEACRAQALQWDQTAPSFKSFPLLAEAGTSGPSQSTTSGLGQPVRDRDRSGNGRVVASHLCNDCNV